MIKITHSHSTCGLSSLYDIIRRILLDQRTVLQNTAVLLCYDKSPSQSIQPEKATSDIKPFSELNLIDDYMFDIATMDLEMCRSIIELSLNIRIRKIQWKEGQKVLHNLPWKRGVRLDFYVEDMEGTIYNVEMQRHSHPALGKRTRFYSALMDAPLLKQGEKGFDRLPRTFLIFICGFDLFGTGKYRYTFQQTCTEVPDLILGDERQIIFLNTKGKNKEEVQKLRQTFHSAGALILHKQASPYEIPSSSDSLLWKYFLRFEIQIIPGHQMILYSVILSPDAVTKTCFPMAV